MAARDYRTTRIRVAALILLDDGIVLVRHRAGASKYHLLPGGGVDYRETLAEALAREVLEETGLVISVGAPLLINDTIDPTGTRHLVNITFAATIVGGALTDTPADPRVEAVEIVSAEMLPNLDLRPPLAEALSHVLAEGVDGFAAQYLGSLFTPQGQDRRPGPSPMDAQSSSREVRGER